MPTSQASFSTDEGTCHVCQAMTGLSQRAETSGLKKLLRRVLPGHLHLLEIRAQEG